MTPGYVIGYQQPVAPARLEAFFKGKLDTDDLVLLMQDLIEVGQANCDPEIFYLAVHCVNNGLCTTTGRPYQ